MVPTLVLVAWNAFILFGIVSDYTSQEVADFIKNTGGQYCQYASMGAHIGGLLVAFALLVAVTVLVWLLARAGRCRLSLTVFLPVGRFADRGILHSRLHYLETERFFAKSYSIRDEQC
jgi:hypothetical protein